MATLKVFKETAVPEALEANSVYFVGPGSDPTVLEIYVSDSTGSAVRKVIDQTKVQNMIDAAIAAGTGGAVIVDTIADRDAISAENAQSVFVVDASADPTVDSGWASYVYRESTTSWIKTSEGESVDIAITWDKLTGKPTSTPGNIDDAVNKRHSHANKTQLDKVNEDGDGNFTYGGVRPRTVWETNAW